MRYDNWDVILFPRDSLVPIQEFRTACYASPDINGRRLPTLGCYISSLAASTPFRISVHSWAAPAKPSPIIESRRKPNQRVVYTAQVVVDGTRVFHGFYEIGSKWPQEIVNEKRSLSDPLVTSSSRGPFLEFPPFHHNVLMQSSWDAQDNSGRIKILLAEQLIRKTNNPGDQGLGASNEIVCFAFQHAPRDILEQAGIAWPIRNPLYLPQLSTPRNTTGTSFPNFPASTKVHDFAAPTRPRTDPPPQFSQWPKPPSRGPRHGTWDTSMQDSFGDSGFDSISMDSWSKGAHSMTDFSMPDLYASGFTKPGDPWESVPPYDQKADKIPESNRQKSGRQVLVTLRDDQLGQLIEAISPPKKANVSSNLQPPPPKMGNLSSRPSAAALARKSSYQDLTKGEKENRPPGPTVYSYSNRVPTPHPQFNRHDSDVSMRDLSSVFSTAPERERRSSPAHVPLAGASVKSRKEGQAANEIRHDQSLLPDLDSKKSVSSDAKAPYNTPVCAPIDPFMPGHKPMSSVDSTVQLERQLFSALGEELSGFNDENMDSVSATAHTTSMPILDDFDSSAGKRKRHGTFGERDRSPLLKMIREDGKSVSRLRGGE
ncbi:hypothetical protein P280DRAFT_509100 [Massarina eburnea CBS 473.64]|uniref:Uncharacterized protein n=1 Tax=Massarina eburnea CBS 473.64 TaxID=1395130 RepID=A0A6A6RTL7_9PLEO|nr:hypothetical protein P280DRAFT_509100 [Massarina eburnea CBS 473.64]